MDAANLVAVLHPSARSLRSVSFFLAACAALWLTSTRSYLLFHSAVEVTSVAIAAAVFMISWSSRGYLEAQPFLLLGIGYLFVSGLDFLHTVTYEGMSVLPVGQDYATKLWVAARGLQAFVTLAFVLLLRARRAPRPVPSFLAVGAVTAFLVFSIFAWGFFPLCFVEGQGVTLFKKLSEYGIALILAVSVALIVRPGGGIGPQEKGLLAGAFALNAASELVFTLYVSAYGYQNLVGHLLKLGSFLLAYHALFSTKIKSRLALIEKLGATTGQLARGQAELRAANDAKDRFFSILAHDLRNPIGGVLSVAEVLATRFDDIPGERVREMCVLLHDGAKQCTELLECLLQWARAQTGRLKARPSAIHLQELCEGLAVLHAPAARTKGVTLRVCVAEDARAFADEDMLAAVLRNLLSNALKFTPRGGEVSLSCVMDPDAARVTVSDTGVGMSAEEREKLFRIDVHYSCPGTDGERGSGMGLILCRELVALNKGAITVTSEPGKGSAFTVTVPRGPMPPA